MTGDEIVISGIVGKFPNCDNIEEIQNNLLNKMDCITDSKTRWDSLVQAMFNLYTKYCI